MGQSFAPEQPESSNTAGRISDQLRLTDDQVRETVEAIFDGSLSKAQLINAVKTGVLRADQLRQISAAYVAAGGAPIAIPEGLQSSPAVAPAPMPEPITPETVEAGGDPFFAPMPPQPSTGGAHYPKQKFRIANLSHQQLLTPNQLSHLIDAIRQKLIHGIHVRLAYEDGRLNRAQVSQLLHAATRSSVTLDDIGEHQDQGSAWPSEQEQVSAWERGTQLSGLSGSNVFEAVDPADISDDSFEAAPDVLGEGSGNFVVAAGDPVDDALEDVDFHAVAVEDQLRERGRARKRKRNTVAVISAWIIASLLSTITISLAVREYGRMEGATKAVSIWLTNEQLPMPETDLRRRHGTLVDHTIRGNWLGRVFSDRVDRGDGNLIDFDGAYAVLLWDETDGKRILLAEYLVGWRGSPREYILLGAVNRLDRADRLDVLGTPNLTPASANINSQ